MKYHKWTEQEIGKIIYILITYIGNGVTMKSLAIELGRHFKTSEKAVLAQFQLYSCPVYVGDGTGQARHALSWDVVSQLKRMKPKGISDILQMQVFPKSSAVVAASKADKDVSYTTVDRQTHPDNMVERFILKELDHNGQQVRRLVRNGSTSDNSLKALILEMYRERRGHLHTIKLFVETEIEVELEHKITVNILH